VTARGSLVVTRDKWGADESLRFDDVGAETWPRDTDPVRGVVLHHTKTPRGEADPLARLRAIYAFHAVDRGWGDIGYHLLVDEAGVVYEGRAGSVAVLDGGPAVIAGHVYGNNPGNVGIALLGTHFEYAPSAAARSSLVALMACLCALHGLDPLDTTSVDGGSLRAHRDLRDTTCPGDAAYALLPALRAQVAATLRTRPLVVGATDP